MARMKAALNKSGTRNRRSLALLVSTSTTAPASARSLAASQSSPSAKVAGVGFRRQADGKEDVRQQSHQHKLLDRRAPLDERQIAAEYSSNIAS